jgi:hypothetical protein
MRIKEVRKSRAGACALVPLPRPVAHAICTGSLAVRLAHFDQTELPFCKLPSAVKSVRQIAENDSRTSLKNKRGPSRLDPAPAPPRIAHLHPLGGFC